MVWKNIPRAPPLPPCQQLGPKMVLLETGTISARWGLVGGPEIMVGTPLKEVVILCDTLSPSCLSVAFLAMKCACAVKLYHVLPSGCTCLAKGPKQ